MKNSADSVTVWAWPIKTVQEELESMLLTQAQSVATATAPVRVRLMHLAVVRARSTVQAKTKAARVANAAKLGAVSERKAGKNNAKESRMG